MHTGPVVAAYSRIAIAYVVLAAGIHPYEVSAEESAAVWLVNTHGQTEAYMEKAKPVLGYSRSLMPGVAVETHVASGDIENDTHVFVVFRAPSHAGLLDALERLKNDANWNTLRAALAEDTGRDIVSKHILIKTDD